VSAEVGTADGTVPLQSGSAASEKGNVPNYFFLKPKGNILLDFYLIEVAKNNFGIFCLLIIFIDTYIF
jgi:hypothetical protein